MNIYTVGAATQGLSNYLKRNFAGEEIRVVVGHDSRNNSRMFAERVADIFASNGFTVFLFDALRPTPELSFAIRELKCQSGVVITASHNPKEYNGYKAYWSDGSQVTAPHDKNIIDEVEKITEVDQVLTGRNPQNIRTLGKDFDELYLNKIHELSLSSESVKRFHDMKIVYSPMHGAGVRLVPQSLKRFGFTNVQMVPEQAVIDGNFPTVESPNPEERKTMSMAIDLAKKVKADLVLATDPDSDRIGVALPDENGEYVLLNGNQTLVLLMTYQLTRWAELGRLNGHQYVIKTIVTTEMVDAVADYFKVKCYECLTGFKYIAKIIRGTRRYRYAVHRRRRGELRATWPGTTSATRTACRPARWRPRPQPGCAIRWVSRCTSGSSSFMSSTDFTRKASCRSYVPVRGCRIDPADDGRLPCQSSERDSRLARGEDQRHSDFGVVRCPHRKEDASGAG